MKIIQLNLYEFAELEETAKEKAIEADRYINVDYHWWDVIYDDFISICETIGVTVDKKNIFFRGFYSQGDGSGFTADIDLPVLLDGIINQKWKNYAPKLDRFNRRGVAGLQLFSSYEKWWLTTRIEALFYFLGLLAIGSGIFLLIFK